METNHRRVIPRLSIASAVFTDELYDELRRAVRGPICRPFDAEFAERSKTFNGKLKPFSSVVVSPLDAQDVSAALRFCTQHGLSPSVRAGGYGIAGWSVAGNLIIDLSMLREVEVEPPLLEVGEGEADWTSLKAQAGTQPRVLTSGSAGDGLHEPVGNLKRRREDHEGGPLTDQQLRSYDNASYAVASFLRGPPLPAEEGEKPREPPTNKQRLHSPDSEAPSFPVERHTDRLAPESMSREPSGESSTSSSSSNMNAMAFSSSAGTTPSRGTPDTDNKELSPSVPQGAGPFSYMSEAASPQVPLPMFSGLSSFGDVSAIPHSFTPGTLNSGTMPWATSSAALSDFSRINGSNSAAFPPFLSSMPSGSNSGSLMSLGNMQPQGHMTRGVSSAQPVHKHAYITFGAGMRQKEIDQYMAEHPLEGVSSVSGAKEDGLVPYHMPSSAHPVGSSIMLLAGFGFLSRLYGLSIDHLVEMEMVLADGRIITVNKDEDPELWWAVRGAGPAFGIATRYKVRAFPVPVVFAGNLIYRFHRATAPSLIKHFRDCIKGVPRELYANVLLTAGPADKDSLVVIQICYVGPKEKGMEYLQAISSWDGERCLLNEVHEKSFLNQQDSVAQVLRGKAGRQWFMRSSLIHSLPDEVINKTVIKFADTPIGCTWLFELAGGAIGDYEDTCLPKEQREAAWTVAALHQWDMGIDDPRCITTAEEWMDTVIKTVAIGGPFPTFLGRHELPSRTMACFGKNWSRLVELKRKYDPQCLLKNNFWPLNKNGEPIEFLENEPPSP